MMGRESAVGESAGRGGDMALGFQLLRASQLKTVRLQLALLQGDRRQAYEAIDALVELDSEMDRFLGDMPPPDAQSAELDEIGRWIDGQRAAIALEKFALASGVQGRAMRSVAGLGSAPAMEMNGAVPALEIEPDASAIEEALEDEAGRRRPPWIIPIVAALLTLAAVVGLLLVGGDADWVRSIAPSVGF